MGWTTNLDVETWSVTTKAGLFVEGEKCAADTFQAFARDELEKSNSRALVPSQEIKQKKRELATT